MLVEKRLNSRHTQTGITLIELMIAIVLGLLLLGAATAMTVSSMVMNGDTLKSARLNQDLDSVLQVMVNDIRRAGYSGGGISFFAADEDLNIVSNSCVLYAYDADENGSLDATDKFGFKLEGNEIFMRTTCTGACATSCTAGTWVALTDNDVISITDLTFDALNSKCLNITHTDNVVEPGNQNNFWVTTADDTTEFSCTDTTSANLTNYILDSDGVYEEGTFVAPQAGDRLIGVRQVNVQMQAELTNDDSMIKTQVVAINVRNNLVTVL